MIVVQFAVVLAAIFLGARLGGIAIGFAGGLGVLVLALLGLKPGAMPLDVVSIIMSVIVAIAAMQVAGGMDYLVDLADRILRRNPRHLTFLAPIITYLMTIMRAPSSKRSADRRDSPTRPPTLDGREGRSTSM